MVHVRKSLPCTACNAWTTPFPALQVRSSWCTSWRATRTASSRSTNRPPLVPLRAHGIVLSRLSLFCRCGSLMGLSGTVIILSVFLIAIAEAPAGDQMEGPGPGMGSLLCRLQLPSYLWFHASCRCARMQGSQIRSPLLPSQKSPRLPASQKAPSAAHTRCFMRTCRS